MRTRTDKIIDNVKAACVVALIIFVVSGMLEGLVLKILEVMGL